MTDTTNKTPGQVACEAAIQASNELDIPYYPQPTEYWDRIASAVLAHAAPKWHPVSEPVPKTGRYWVRRIDGVEEISTLFFGKTYFNTVTHWCGPIEPPPFQTKEGV